MSPHVVERPFRLAFIHTKNDCHRRDQVELRYDLAALYAKLRMYEKAEDVIVSSLAEASEDDLHQVRLPGCGVEWVVVGGADKWLW